MDFLPDSRLKDRSCETVVGDFQLPDGRSVRLEMSPLYCVGCGKLGAYCPKDNTIGVTYICRKCFEADSNAFAGCVVSDEQFARDVAYEMERRFGRSLTEIEVAQNEGNLGAALEALVRDSPYPGRDNRPKGA